MSQVSPYPPTRQVLHLRIVRDEESPPYDVGPTDAEPPTVSGPEPTAAILRSCGAMAVAVYYIARSNPDAGIPNTYAMLEEQCELKTRQMQYVCKALVEHGFFAVSETGGGRGRERRFVAVNPAQKGAQNGAEECTETQETVHKRVQSPPYIPPVCESTVPSENDTHIPPTPKPAKPLPENGPAQQIVAAFCREAGIEAPAVYRKAVGQAAMLAKAKVTADDVPDLYAYSVQWAGTADLGTMLQSVDRWRQRRRSTGAPTDVSRLPYNSPKRLAAEGKGFVG